LDVADHAEAHLLVRIVGSIADAGVGLSAACYSIWWNFSGGGQRIGT
jgi:hypothetical protein